MKTDPFKILTHWKERNTPRYTEWHLAVVWFGMTGFMIAFERGIGIWPQVAIGVWLIFGLWLCEKEKKVASRTKLTVNTKKGKSGNAEQEDN